MSSLLEGISLTACMLVTALLYLVWSPFYRGQTYVQGEGQTTA